MTDSDYPGQPAPGWEWAEQSLAQLFESTHEGIQHMNFDDIYSTGSHLKASDLPHDVQAVISGHEVVKFDDGPKLVLRFQGKDKTLVLNKTNATMVSEMYGKDVDQWAGKTITIGPDRTNYAGQVVPCIRVRYQAPAVAPAQQQPAPQATQPEPAQPGRVQAADPFADDIPF